MEKLFLSRIYHLNLLYKRITAQMNISSDEEQVVTGKPQERKANDKQPF